MYQSAPSTNLGPGTGLIEQYPGMGFYAATPAYALTPAGQAGIRGMGCGCAGVQGCGCAGGMGIFESGMDVSQWGVPEFAIAALGAYVLISVFDTTRRTSASVRRKSRALRKAVRS